MKFWNFFAGFGFVACVTLQSNAVAAGPKIAILFDKGGKDDKSFNSSAYDGAKKAEKEFGASLKYVEAPDDHVFESMLKSFAKKDFDLVIAIGINQREALTKIAPQFPDKKFLIIDAELNAPNVASVLFEEHEGSYLAGVAAGKATKTKKVGFIGGMDVPVIRRFQLGYEAGFKSVVPDGKILINYLGVTGEAWNNPPRAKELTLSQINQGADVIFHASGASGAGVFDAVEDKKVLAIGVDSNQNGVKPGRVLTSMMKRVDEAVYQTIVAISKNAFKAEVVRLGLKSRGVDLAKDENNKSIYTQEIEQAVAKARAAILSGAVKVPDYFIVQKK